MKELLLSLLVASYGVIGIVHTLAYWPTIKDLHFHKKPSANITSFIIFTSATLVTFLYSIFILDDFLLRLISGLNLTACATVLFLRIKLRHDTNKGIINKSEFF